MVNEWRLQQWQDMEKISISEKMAAGKDATLKGEVKPEKRFGAMCMRTAMSMQNQH